LNGCRVREVPETRLAREEFGLRPVRLADTGFLHLDTAQFNPYGFFAFSTGLDIGLNDTLFIDNFLEVVQEEIVIRV
jgi:hypothetical protein